MSPFDLWTSPDVIATLDRQGWPEWVLHDDVKERLGVDHSGSYRYFLHLYARAGSTWDCNSSFVSGWSADISLVGEQEGIALLRDDSRERLAANGVFVDQPGEKWRVYGRGGTVLSNGAFVPTGDWQAFDTYDEALIAARRAMKENT